jgi:hypothetical protein
VQGFSSLAHELPSSREGLLCFFKEGIENVMIYGFELTAP